MTIRFTKQGFSLIELIVAISIFSVLIAGTTFLVAGPFTGSSNNREAERFAREALGALDIITERSWTQIDSNDDGTDKKVNRDSNGDWVIASGTETRGSFTRAIAITSVERNSSGVIVTSGGTDDPSTKKIVVTISATGVEDYVLETYVVNWESYRMSQTDWSGSSGTNVWTDASTGYYSSSSSNGMNTPGSLYLSDSYAATGSLTSASIDTTSYPTIKNQNILRATWTQVIPSGCTLTLSFRGTNAGGATPDYTGIAWEGPYSGAGTTVTQDLVGNANLQGKRYFQYKVDMANCNSGNSTPELSDIQLEFD